MNRDIDSYWNKIQSGDERAFDTLFEILYPLLVGFAFRILHDLQEAEETVQDAFVNLWNQRFKINLRGSLKSYIYQVVHNLALNRLQHIKSKKFHPNKTVNPEEWRQILNMLTIEDDFINMVEANETEEIMHKVIDQLPTKCREVFLLSRFDCMSNSEIADKLHLSPATVRVHIFKALSAIRETILKTRA